ncbi:MAG: sugar ABC transporter permease [Lachnospiraceae bacterium]|nr:sugar ABC transporter permease [Lachnospiraceae bacterium]
MSKMTKQEKKNRKRVKPGRLARREAITGLLFISPWIVGACIFLAYPLITSFWYALNNIRITPMGKSFTFVGHGNFTQIIMSDPDFPTQMIDYITSTILSVPIIVVFALIIAMMLNENIKGKGFFRLIFFLPVIIVSGPILGMLTQQGAGSITAIDTQAISGAIESFLPHALAEPISELFENMITILWYSGVQILIFLSALQKIDRSMYEAAKIDGGSGWECFWKITLPTVKPMILLNCVYTVVFISNNDQNAIIELIKGAMFSGTREKGYGYASAMAWMYSVVVVLIVCIFAVLLLARKDVYERQIRKYKKQVRKEMRLAKKIGRRSARNAKKIQKARQKRGYKTYDGSGDY